MSSCPGSETPQRPSAWRYISWPSLIFSIFGTSFFCASFFWGEAMARAVGLRKDIPLAVGIGLMMVSSVWSLLASRKTRKRIMADWDKLTQTDELEFDSRNLARAVIDSNLNGEFQSVFSIFSSMLLIVGLNWKQPLTQLLYGSEFAVFLLTIVPTLISCVWMHRTNKQRKSQLKEVRAELETLNVAVEGVKRRRDP